MRSGRATLRLIWTLCEKLILGEACSTSILSEVPHRRMISRLRVRTRRDFGLQWDSSNAGLSPAHSKIDVQPAILLAHLLRGAIMDMLMIVFRSSLADRVHEILDACGVIAYTEFPETIGRGASGPTEGVSFY